MRRSLLASGSVVTVAVSLACGGAPTLAEDGGVSLGLRPATLEVADVLSERLHHSGLHGEVRLRPDLVYVDLIGPEAPADELALYFTMPGRFEIFAVDEAKSSGDDIALLGAALLTNTHVIGVSQGGDQYGEPHLNLELSERGATLFGELSARVVGQRLALVVDGTVVSAPVVRERIDGGRVRLTGLDEGECHALQLALQAGQLPPDMELVETRVIGPAE